MNKLNSLSDQIKSFNLRLNKQDNSISIQYKKVGNRFIPIFQNRLSFKLNGSISCLPNVNDSWIEYNGEDYFIPKDKQELEELLSYFLNEVNSSIIKEITFNGITKSISQNNIIVSKITDMSDLFYNEQSFNQDISKWDVSGVQNFEGMFFGQSSFNQNLTSWDVERIPTEPYNFSSGSQLTQENSPRWGEKFVLNDQPECIPTPIELTFALGYSDSSEWGGDGTQQFYSQDNESLINLLTPNEYEPRIFINSIPENTSVITCENAFIFDLGLSRNIGETEIWGSASIYLKEELAQAFYNLDTIFINGYTCEVLEVDNHYFYTAPSGYAVLDIYFEIDSQILWNELEQNEEITILFDEDHQYIVTPPTIDCESYDWEWDKFYYNVGGKTPAPSSMFQVGSGSTPYRVIGTHNELSAYFLKPKNIPFDVSSNTLQGFSTGGSEGQFALQVFDVTADSENKLLVLFAVSEMYTESQYGQTVYVTQMGAFYSDSVDNILDDFITEGYNSVGTASWDSSTEQSTHPNVQNAEGFDQWHLPILFSGVDENNELYVSTYRGILTKAQDIFQHLGNNIKVNHLVTSGFIIRQDTEIYNYIRFDFSEAELSLDSPFTRYETLCGDNVSLEITPW